MNFSQPEERKRFSVDARNGSTAHNAEPKHMAGLLSNEGNFDGMIGLSFTEAEKIVMRRNALNVLQRIVLDTGGSILLTGSDNRKAAVSLRRKFMTDPSYDGMRIDLKSMINPINIDNAMENPTTRTYTLPRRVSGLLSGPLIGVHPDSVTTGILLKSKERHMYFCDAPSATVGKISLSSYRTIDLVTNAAEAGMNIAGERLTISYVDAVVLKKSIGHITNEVTENLSAAIELPGYNATSITYEVMSLTVQSDEVQYQAIRRIIANMRNIIVTDTRGSSYNKYGYALRGPLESNYRDNNKLAYSIVLKMFDDYSDMLLEMNVELQARNKAIINNVQAQADVEYATLQNVGDIGYTSPFGMGGRLVEPISDSEHPSEALRNVYVSLLAYFAGSTGIRMGYDESDGQNLRTVVETIPIVQAIKHTFNEAPTIYGKDQKIEYVAKKFRVVYYQGFTKQLEGGGAYVIPRTATAMYQDVMGNLRYIRNLNAFNTEKSFSSTESTIASATSASGFSKALYQQISHEQGTSGVDIHDILNDSYRAINRADMMARNSLRLSSIVTPEAISVYYRDFNNQRVYIMSVRGTNSLSDVFVDVKMALGSLRYTARFHEAQEVLSKLMEQLRNSEVNSEDYNAQVFLIGHSLGGSIVSKLKAPEGPTANRIYKITYNKGATITTASTDTNELSVRNTGDVISIAAAPWSINVGTVLVSGFAYILGGYTQSLTAHSIDRLPEGSIYPIRDDLFY